MPEKCHAGVPRVLLTTLPGEQHGLGLLMVEALLVPEGAQCISLGTQTPIDDIRNAALAHKVHVVALSFSAAFPLRQAGEGLATLRRFQDDVKEVRSALECGIKLGDFSEYQVGDIIECYLLEQIAQKL